MYFRLGSHVHTSKAKLRALSDSADSRQLGHGVSAAACGVRRVLVAMPSLGLPLTWPPEVGPG